MDSPAQPWYKRVLAAWAFSASVSGLLFAVTALPCINLLYKQGQTSMAAYSFACFPLASAGLLLTVLAVLVPSLVNGNAMRFPLNLTLPSLYSGLVALSSLLMANFMPSIALLGDTPRTDQLWGRTDFLGTAWFVQVACTSSWAAISDRKRKVKT